MDFAFNKADSRNLPKVDMVTVLEFLKTDSNFFLSELRGIKAQRSSKWLQTHHSIFILAAPQCSEEPSKTEVSCYWKKPTLSKVGTLEPYEVASQPSSSTAVDGDAFFNSIVNKLKNLKPRPRVMGSKVQK
ncbi:hypothetical protein M8J77_006243 [Diaphorina citri]|nr:hypothetical protein M8J77_006243 [Diaphorina citri]